MTNIQKVLKSIYSNESYSKLGVSIVVENPIPICIDNHPYILFIANYSSLKGNFLKYEYVLYSIEKEETLTVNSEEYREITSKFPTLDNPDLDGAKVVFGAKSRLNKIINDLVSVYLEKGKLDESERNAYLQCLKELKEIHPNTLKKVYEFLAVLV